VPHITPKPLQQGLEAGMVAMSVRARKTRRSHEIIFPRSATERQKVNSRKADEVFAEDGWRNLGDGELPARRRQRGRSFTLAGALRDIVPSPSLASCIAFCGRLELA